MRPGWTVAERFDLLVLGGGIQGATAACEASRRGLSVLLVERDDFGAGASANSLKVAHGGLRYLQSLDLARSFESVRERRRLLRMAPGVVRPLPVRLDLTGRGAAYRGLFRAGLLANDLLSLHRNRDLPRDSHLPASRFPVWWDALIDDTERVLLAFLQAAVRAAPDRTRVCNHARVEAWREREGRVVGALVEGIGEIETDCVLHCTGATREREPAVLAMNLMVDGLALTADGQATALRHPDEGRNVFAVPWRGRTILGTHNRRYPYDPAAPLRVEPAWVEELLAWLRPVHPELATLARGDVRLIHAGLLPAASSAERDPDPSDTARVTPRPDGGIDVRGVKWTTAYGLSRRAVDRVVGQLGRGAGAGPDEPVIRTPDPTDLPEGGPSGAGERLVAGHPLTDRQVLRAVREEWARGLEDVLLRRTGAASAGHPGRDLVEAASRCLQAELDWSERERAERAEAFNESFHFAGNAPASAG